MREPRLWSYRRFFSYALLLSVLFALAHLAGLKDHTAVLAGTHSGGVVPQYFGVAYLIVYVMFVCLVPVLVIAGLLLLLGERLTRQRGDLR